MTTRPTVRPRRAPRSGTARTKPTDQTASSRPPQGRNYLSTTIQKAFDILNLFKDHTELSFREIQQRLGFNKSTLFRLLYTLEQNQYVTKSESGKYHLGLRLFILGNSFSRESQILKVATPYLKELSQKINLTVHLGILEGTNVVILHKIDPPNGIRMLSRIGLAVPAHCTGQGKALLAFSPGEKVEEIINFHGLKRFTPNTITTAEGLFEELKLTWQRGYAIANSEHEKHIKCVAVPVLNRQGGAEAALSITGLVVDFPAEQTIETYASLLQGVAANISRELGFA